MNALKAGSPETDVLRGFLTSQEYTAAHSDAGSLIQGLYEDVLGREPDAAGEASWQTVAAIPGNGRRLAIDGILNSAEADLRVLDFYYARFLHRQPDTAGEQFWLGLLETGRATRASVREAFLNSDEFFARSTTAVHSSSVQRNRRQDMICMKVRRC